VTRSPVRSAVRGEISRRRVQTVVIGLVLLVTTAASVLALALVTDSNAPFDQAFAAQRGAEATMTFDARASRVQLAATAGLPGVTAAAGPFAEVATSLAVTVQTGPRSRARLLLPAMTIAGRPSPAGPVDDVVLKSGHWPTGPGQIVLSEDQPDSSLPPVTIGPGSQVTVTGVPGKPVLTVVGMATSVTGSADAWVAPAEIARLAPPHVSPGTQMLYRFGSSGSAAAIRADVGAVASSLPAGAVTSSQDYLSVRLQEESGIAPLAPFVATFGIIGLVMSVVIVTNVVSGAVVAGYRRIGVLKSVGFTPGQVVAAYSAQALLPAAAGCLGGVAAGNLLSGALLGRAASVYQVGTLGVPAWVNLTVPAAMLVLVAVAALLPAIRASRLSAVQAIAAGRAPRRGHGYRAHRALGQLPLPRPVTIGLAGPFARPARAAVTAVAILLGAGTVTLAIGVGISLSRVQDGLSLSHTEQAFVFAPPPGPQTGGIRVKSGSPVPAAPKPKRPAQITAAIRAQPGTLHVTEEADQEITVAGVGKQVPVTAYLGAAGWIGYGLISGRWYAGPGQIDVPTYFLTVTGKSVGDPVTLTYGDTTFTARIVGEIFSDVNNGLSIVTGWPTLAAADRGLTQPGQWDIELRPGTSAAAYVQALGRQLGPAYGVGLNGAGAGLPLVLGLVGLLTLALATVAGLGVLNTVVLQTRERVHDLGVFRAVGMTPRQTVAMVVCWVAGVGLLAGLAAVPAGIALHHYLVPVMARAAGTALPASILDVYGTALVAALALTGAVIAVAGALAPAGWAAAARTDSALRAE
jgi:putative ABC transport system permease protein